ncbi:MAG: quinone oxidoreductase [Actinomycetes bacterium]|jgi:NADPH2:quinone reductase|nr:MAG: NADPH:quinone reductase [Actinomycetota bacterium]
MRAALVTAKGGPEVIEVADQPIPEPGPGQLLVKVAAGGVNFIDIYQREGVYPMEYPFVPGNEGAGTVEAVGEGVTTFGPGDRVGWSGTLGSFREYHLVPADRAVAVPEDVDLETAAAALLQGMTAHFLVHGTFPLGPGHRCLIHAGAGGVGLLLTQMAKMLGAEVATTVGSPEKAELSRAAGADLVIDYTQSDFAAEIEAAWGPRPLDVVYDGVGASTFEKGLTLLKKRGMMVTFGNASGVVPPVAPLELMRNGSLFLTRPMLYDYVAERADLERRASDVFRWIAAGDLQVRIGGRYTLDQVAQAQVDLASRKTTGKLIVVL